MKNCWKNGASIFALTCAAMVGTQVQAADMYSGESLKDGGAVPVQASPWSGFYIGAHIGGGWGDGDDTVTARGGTGGGGGGGGGDNNWSGVQRNSINGGNGADGDAGGAGGRGGNRNAAGNAVFPGPGTPNLAGRRLGGIGGDGGEGGSLTGGGDDDDSILGGIHMGYNWQRGDVLLGIEGDASFSDSLDDYLASLRARVGFVRGNTLIYATGGLAFRDEGGSDVIGLASNGGRGGDGGANDDIIDDPLSEAGTLTSIGGQGGNGGGRGSGSVTSSGGGDDGSETGYVVGGGVEMMLSSGLSAGVEGLHYVFDGDDGDEDFTVVRARLTMHLNRDEDVSYKDLGISVAPANWAGFYAGVHIGAGFREGDHVDSIRTADGERGERGGDGAVGRQDIDPRTGRPFTDGIDDPGGAGGGGGGGAAAIVSLADNSALMGGVHLGYNFQDGSRIIGLEGDASWSDDELSEYLASVRLRLGYARGQSMVFATAGIAFAGSSDGGGSVSLSRGRRGRDGNPGCQENVDGACPPVRDDTGGLGGRGGRGGTATVTGGGDGDHDIGFVIGGGFEHKLTQNLSLGIEGLYYAFDLTEGEQTATSFESDEGGDMAVVRARLTYHLDRAEEPLK